MTYTVFYDKIIGRGYKGTVYLTKKEIETECNYVTKTPVESSECYISKVAGDNGIGPKIFEIKDNHIVMEKLNGLILEEFIEKDIYLEKEISKLLVNKILKFHELGWIHRDLHLNNVFVEMKDNKPTNFKIIDYGFSERLYDINTVKDIRHLYILLKNTSPNNMKELIILLKGELDKRRKKPRTYRKMKKKRKKKVSLN